MSYRHHIAAVIACTEWAVACTPQANLAETLPPGRTAPIDLQVEHANQPAWRVGTALLAVPEARKVVLGHAEGEQGKALIGQGWALKSLNAAPRWMAQCTAGSYAEQVLHDGAVWLLQKPASVECALQSEDRRGSFRLDLAATNPDAELGLFDFDGQRVEVVRDQPLTGSERPRQFALKLDGMTLGWLHGGAEPQLWLAVDGNTQQVRALQAAAALLIALDQAAPLRLERDLLAVPGWAEGKVCRAGR